MSENKFVPGLFAKAPHERAPDFVKVGLSIKIVDLGNFLRAQKAAGEEWVNVQIKQSKGGKWYTELDDWKPDPNKNNQPPSSPQSNGNDFDSDSIPF